MTEPDEGVAPHVAKAAAKPADAPTSTPEDLARAAMERARASARQRGATTSSPAAHQRRRAQRKAATDAEVSPHPFGAGRDPAPMSAALNALLDRMGWRQQLDVASVTARWREVIGDQIADNSSPVSFDDGVLVLRASSSAWATQLALMEGQLRHRLNEELGTDIVTELRFLGPTQRSWVKGPRTVKGRGPRDTYG